MSEPFRRFRSRRDFLGAFAYLEEEAGVLVVSNVRRIDGEERPVWDLPGGGVEPGETLEEALHREMREETGLGIGIRRMLFVAEGERIAGGERVGVWRSFFFEIERVAGEIDHSADPEILGHRFVPVSELPPLLTAPYHAGFVRWLASGGELRHVFDRWED